MEVKGLVGTWISCINGIIREYSTNTVDTQVNVNFANKNHVHNTWSHGTSGISGASVYKNEDLKIVLLRFYRSSQKVASGDNTVRTGNDLTTGTIVYLPSDYRPLQPVSGGCFNTKLSYQVETDGSIKIHSQEAQTSWAVNFTAIYPTN